MAGVGTTTVSRVINNGSVRADTRSKVLDAMEKLQFHPHVLARGLRTKRIPTVGMIISDISNPLFAEIVQSAHQVLADRGYQLELGITNTNPTEETHLFESFIRQGVSGIIASLTVDSNKKITRFITGLNIPIVLLDRQLVDIDMNVVTNDHAKGSKEAVDYLAALGHTKISLILSSSLTYPGRIRKQSILSQLSSHGITIPECYIHEVSLEPEQGYKSMMKLLNCEDRPTAVIVGSNQIFIGALQAMRQLGIEYPKDISIISFDDIYLTKLLSPDITIVNRNLKDFGAEAAHLVITQIEHPSAGITKRILPTWLEIRGSCRRV
ncbi:LacI family transcriptional regulator [Alicyclobacillus acidoterrestris]|nr:LacI family transcriptional regulator [Alicyclobacillus acidoterrestris]